MPRPPTGQVLEKTTKSGRVYALRFRAYGRREYLTLGRADEGWSRARAELELQNVLADVRRGVWQPPGPPVVVEAPAEAPTFHVFASEWVAAREHEVDERTVDYWRWALELHLLPFFAGHRVSAIDVAAVERYKTGKLAARERGGEGGLSNGSINKTLAVLAQILDHAIDLGNLEANPARGRKRRLKAARPKRTWLELVELRALLDGAGDARRPLLAAMALAGLRVGEACALRWRDVDLVQGVLRVEDAKTDAGVRKVDLTPDLVEELRRLRAKSPAIADALVFPTRNGTMRDRHNVRSRVLAGAVKAANARLAEQGLPPLPAGITNHTLRRTFCALLYEAGASPGYVMAQMGHTSANLALEVYNRVMERKRDTGARVDELLRSAERAPTGTSGVATLPTPTAGASG